MLLGSLGDTNNFNFYSISKKSTEIGGANISNSYFTILFVLDQEVGLYNRTVYSFFDMFGFIGGIFGLAHSVAFIFVQFVADRQFYSFVISKVNMKNRQNVENNDGCQNNQNSRLNEVVIKHKLGSANLRKIEPIFESKNTIYKKNNKNNQMNEEVKSNLAMNISNSFKLNQCEEIKVTSPFDNNEINCDQKSDRFQFKAENTATYSYKDFVFELLCLHKCKYKPCERIGNKMKLFREQSENFNADIDCLQIVKSIRELQELRQRIEEEMEQNQQVIEAYQQSRYFDSSVQIESNVNPQSLLCFHASHEED